MKNIVELLIVWRHYNEYSLREAAAKLGLSHSTLLRIERGKPMDMKAMLVLIKWVLS